MTADEMGAAQRTLGGLQFVGITAVMFYPGA
jgi:hypothetical protein